MRFFVPSKNMLSNAFLCRNGMGIFLSHTLRALASRLVGLPIFVAQPTLIELTRCRAW